MHRQCCRPVPRLRWNWRSQFHLNRGTVKKCSWGWANLSPETCRAELKRLINEKVVASCWLFTSLYWWRTVTQTSSSYSNNVWMKWIYLFWNVQITQNKSFSQNIWIKKSWYYIVKKVLVYSWESVHKQRRYNLPTTYRHEAATSPTTFFFEFWWISQTNCMIYTTVNGKFICSNYKFQF